MALGGIIFSLTAMGIRGVIFRQATLVIGIIVFRRATLAIRNVAVCRITTAMCGEHNNQPKEGHTSKMPAYDPLTQLTREHRDEEVSKYVLIIMYSNTPPQYNIGLMLDWREDEATLHKQ
jgi:hypothetical protein